MNHRNCNLSIAIKCYFLQFANFALVPEYSSHFLWYLKALTGIVRLWRLCDVANCSSVSAHHIVVFGLYFLCQPNASVSVDCWDTGSCFSQPGKLGWWLCFRLTCTIVALPFFLLPVLLSKYSILARSCCCTMFEQTRSETDALRVHPRHPASLEARETENKHACTWKCIKAVKMIDY